MQINVVEWRYRWFNNFCSFTWESCCNHIRNSIWIFL